MEPVITTQLIPEPGGTFSFTLPAGDNTVFAPGVFDAMIDEVRWIRVGERGSTQGFNGKLIAYTIAGDGTSANLTYEAV